MYYLKELNLSKPKDLTALVKLMAAFLITVDYNLSS